VVALVTKQLADLVSGQRTDPVGKRGHRKVVVVAEWKLAAVRGGHRTSSERGGKPAAES
jgi:hypothetical protein